MLTILPIARLKPNFPASSTRLMDIQDKAKIEEIKDWCNSKDKEEKEKLASGLTYK